MDRKVFFALVAFVALLGYLYMVFTVLGPFLRSLAWAFIIGLITFPLYRRLRRRLGHRHLLAAAVMTPAVLLVFVLPVVVLILMMTQEVTGIYQLLEKEVAEAGPISFESLQNFPLIRPLVEQFQPYLDQFGFSFREAVQMGTGKVMGFLLDYSSAIVRNSLAFTAKVVLMVMALFYIYKDGEVLLEKFWSVVPIPDENRTVVAGTVKRVLSAIVYGIFLTCLVQGLLAGIGYWLFDLPLPLLFGALTAVAALIPVVGTALIWVPAAGYLLMGGKVSQGLLLSLWCFALVVPADNLIRPFFISGRGQLSLLVVALGLLGGLAAFGFLGIILGPLILALFGAFLDIYRGQLVLPENGREE
jgi:predicted PurR-regulated permease PerM